MKGKILKLVTILSLFMLMLSCGSDKKEEAKQEGAATEAKADNKEVKKYVIGSDVLLLLLNLRKTENMKE